ncbi:MAG: O-antigen ligase family protein [Magnetococcales bacterium]|nr:O-antigen ligase family protein [Magnetococcales bacterium]
MSKILQSLITLPLLWWIAGYWLITPHYNLIPDIQLSAYDEQRFFELILLACGVLLTLAPTFRAQWLEVLNAIPGRLKILTAFFFLCGLLSAWFSLSPRAALQEVSLLLLLAMLTLGIAAHLRTHGEQAVVWVAVMVMAVCTWISLMLLDDFFYFLEYMKFMLDPAKFFSRFVSLRFFNQFQTWTFPLLALPYLFWSARLGRWKWALHLPSALWWSWWMFTGGRGVLMAMTVACVLLWVMFRQQALPWLHFQWRSLLVGSIIYIILFEVLTPTNTSETLLRLHDPARLKLWAAAWQMAVENPWLGIGPQHYAWYYPFKIAAHPHNLTMQILAEWGMPAFVAFAVITVWGWRGWFRSSVEQVKEESVTSPILHHTRIALTGSFVAGITHAQVCGLLVMPLSQVAGALVFGMMLGLHQRATTGHSHASQLSAPAPFPTPATPSRSQAWTLVLTGLTLVSVLGWSLFPQITRLQDDKLHFTQVYPKRAFAPRFWNQGLIHLPETTPPTPTPTPTP